MTAPRTYSPRTADLSCDLLVVGGGVFGLWIARHAALRGLDTILIEKDRVGSGASGGLLGALIPHLPERWDAKKKFQFEALTSLPDLVRAIEEETGLDCGYRRCGRLMPLWKESFADIAVKQTAAARQNWSTPETGFAWDIVERPPLDGWPAADAMPLGLVVDTLAARIDPRSYLAALRRSIESRVRIIESEAFEACADGVVETSGGKRIMAGRTVLSAGYETFPILGQLLGGEAASYGRPVKGQAALLAAELDDDLPLVFHDGTYVIVHDGGRVAVGSTSEQRFDAPFSTDAALDTVLDKARRLCPAIAGAPVIERWAGLRPRAVGRNPMIGALPDHPDVIVATGGFKITFGIAHKMAECVIDLATGGTPDLPESFRFAAHLKDRK
ncbi:MAG: oxidoreductase [Rhizobiaceae bacterium MnEN-MB40S]|nr:MAG: oxidoreductase [Rhizobiaceae bacterium MnEN-MB40S]